MTSLRHVASTTPSYPPILFFHHGTAEQGAAFFERSWPEARAVSDATKQFYTSFGLSRGTVSQLIGPSALIRGVQAVLKGHGIGRPVGDTLLMPGAFVVHKDRVLWQHEYRHVGDHPDFVRVMAHAGLAT